MPLDFAWRLLRSTGPCVLQGAAATAWLKRFHDEVATMIAVRMPRWSAVRWQFLLRRLPASLWAGWLGLPSTIGYDSLLAEVLARRMAANRADHWNVNSTLQSWIDDDTAWVLADYVAMVKLLSNVQVSARWIGKGAELILGNASAWTSQLWPSYRATPELTAAVELYDRRIEGGNLFPGTGVRVEAGASHDEERIPVRIRPVDGALADLGWLSRAERPGSPIPVQTSTQWLQTDRIRNLLAQGFVKPDRLLMPLLALAIERASETCGNRTTKTVRGYLVGELRHMNEPFWKSTLDAALVLVREMGVDTSAVSTWHSIAAAADGSSAEAVGEPWPLVAPEPFVLCRTTGTLLIDTVWATSRLHRILEACRETGSIANVRAARWEQDVQAAVDATPWAPRGTARELIRKPLRRAGADITDIDALAVSPDGTQVLLLSCKSKPYRAPYDAGEFAEVRNIRMALEADERDWDRKTKALAQHRRGDNYSLPDGVSIRGLVVTPVPFFVMAPTCLKEVIPGVRAVCSLAELVDGLQNGR